MMKLLEAIGFPTTMPNGHVIGCGCDECQEHRNTRRAEISERIQAGKPPETLGEILVAARRQHDETRREQVRELRPSKVLFLDIDGVLNSWRWVKVRVSVGGVDDEPHPQVSRLDPTAVRLMNDVIERTGASVVISSTWRLFGLRYVNEALAEAGATFQGIDVTPHQAIAAEDVNAALKAGWTWERMKTELYVRGREIQSWLSACPSVESFAIVDDDDDMGPLSPRLVKTSFERGLEREHVEKLVQLLGAR